LSLPGDVQIAADLWGHAPPAQKRDSNMNEGDPRICVGAMVFGHGTVKKVGETGKWSGDAAD
jgi:hypothetical protein